MWRRGKYAIIFFSNGLCLLNAPRWTKQWGRSNKPRIRPGTVKSLNATWELSQLALRRDYDKKIDPCRMLVWLERRTVQNMVKYGATIGSGQYCCYLAGRYKLGRSCSNSNLLRPRLAHIHFIEKRNSSFFNP